MNGKIYRQLLQIAAEGILNESRDTTNLANCKYLFTVHFQTEIHKNEEKFLVEMSFRIVHGLFTVQ